MIKSSVLNFVRQKADEARQLADLHDTLKSIADQSQAIAAEEKKLATLRGAGESLAADINAAQARIKDLQEQAVKFERDRESMNAVMRFAQAAADEKAKKTVADAEAQAKSILDNANLHLTSKQSELARLNLAVETVSGDLRSLQSDHSELQKKHAELQRKHDQLAAGLAALKPNL